MKLSNLSLAILGALTLVGCDSDDSSSSPIDNQSRMVEVSVLQKEVGDMNATSFTYAIDSVKDGYTVVIDELDDGGDNKTKTGYQITDGGYVQDIEVVGAAKITIYHPDAVVTDEIMSNYYLDGSAQIGAHESEVTVTMKNERFAQVTLDDSSDIYKATLNDEVMFNAPNGEAWKYGFVAKDSVLAMDTRVGLLTDTVEIETGRRYSYAVVVDENGNIRIDDKWRNGDMPQPSDPVVDSKDVLGAQIVGWDIDTGATHLYINGKVVYDRNDKAVTAPSITQPADGSLLNVYKWNVDVEQGYGMHVDIYIGEKCWVDSIKYHVDSGDFYYHTPADGANIGTFIGSSWEDVITSEYGEEAVPFCSELPMGNFYLRMSASDKNYQSNFTVNSYSITK
ncbi:hypothetical protein ACPV4O_20310 [Vibrio owensii]|uniref:hypothetical protein n=1 Tax=Vibrio harveyi group TaxID=717610 RepID=UPI00289413DE|nr:putative lipoprotein [Vibrio jasicida]